MKLFVLIYCFTIHILHSKNLQIPINIDDLLNYKSSSIRAEFPPPIDYYDNSIWILDAINTKIKSLNKDKKDINLKKFKKSFPVDDFKIMSYGKIFLMSKQLTSLALFDIYSKKLKILSKKSAKNDMFFEMTSLKKRSNQVFVSDLVSGYIRIFSEHGYFLGSLQSFSHDFLPFSATEAITLHSEGNISSLGWTALSGGKKVFYSQEKTKKDEFISLSFAGIDSSKNVYVQKIYGTIHGLAKLAVQKISPDGSLVFEKKVNMSLFEYQEFQRFFFIKPDGSMFQFKYVESSNSLVLKELGMAIKS
ncbi:MAG: hypothetical protein COB02_02155 [Candidatus Cloacimonadota bacterium]|nr:MAG: hypothetical protein COB02_02155 [Candidatus Cloacimonadota bacterium]